MTRINQLAEEKAKRLLAEAERQLTERKTSPQFVGTHNVRYVITPASDPAWAGTLPQSQQAPGVGTKILRLTATTKRQTDLFGRIVTEMYVGSTPTRYRPSHYLADMNAGQPGFQAQIMDDISFGFQRNTKTWVIVINGKLSTPVQLNLWFVANDEVTLNLVEVN